MLSDSAKTRCSPVWLVWLLVGSIAAQAVFAPAAGCEWIIANASATEEESDSREGPTGEQIEEVLAAGSLRDPREHHSLSESKERTSVALQRRLTLYAFQTGQSIEMARRNGVGSLLRC